MTDVVWERDLADEPNYALSNAEENRRMGFVERFALAEDVDAKRALARAAFVADSEQAVYYNALCALLEVQKMMETGDAAQWERALEVLQEGAIERAEEELRRRQCQRKAQRLLYRRSVLVLELQLRLKKDKAALVAAGKKLGEAMTLTYNDRAPNTTTSTTSGTDTLPSTLEDDVWDVDAIVDRAVQAVKAAASISTHRLATSVRTELQSFDGFLHELFYKKFACVETAERLGFTNEQRWLVLELFLNELAFDFTDIDGFPDVIVEDLARNENFYRFGSRSVHSKLSLSTMDYIQKKAPNVVENSVEFATRGVMLRMSAASSAAELSGWRCDSSSRLDDLKNLSEILTYLSAFSLRINSLRLVILHKKLRLLRLVHLATPTAELLLNIQDALIDYISIPRPDAQFMNQTYLQHQPKYASAVFSTSSSSYSNSSTVSDVARELGWKIRSADDEQLIKDALSLVWISPPTSQALEDVCTKCLDAEFLKKQRALYNLRSGMGEVSALAKELDWQPDRLATLTNTTEISFCESNLHQFGPDEDIVLRVQVRNVQTLTVHLYEIKTVDYYARMRQPIRGNICVDGLLPNKEKRVDLANLSPFQESTVSISFAEDGLPQRGVFVIEVFEGGVSCRAIVRKGFFRHVEKISNRGHEFVVVSETGVPVCDSSALVLPTTSSQAVRQYQADASGVIVIPFRDGEAGFGENYSLAFVHNGFGHLHQQFLYMKSSYVLKSQIYVDSEQLLPGSTATVCIRPVLVGDEGHELSLDTLTSVELSFQFFSQNSQTASVKKMLKYTTVKHLLDDVVAIDIPVDAAYFDVKLSGRVSVSGERKNEHGLPQVQCSKRFQVQQITDYSTTFTPHLVRQLDSSKNMHYAVEIRGHNGEKIPMVDVDLTLSHVHLQSEKSVRLRSNSEGKLVLGRLVDVRSICVSISPGSDGVWKWELPNLRTCSPHQVNCMLHDEVVIPVPHAYSDAASKWLHCGLVRVWQVDTQNTEATVIADATSTCDLKALCDDKGTICRGYSLRMPRCGNFVVHIRPLNVKHPITVGSRKLDCAINNGVLLKSTQLLLLTPTEPPVIEEEKMIVSDGRKMLRAKVNLPHPESSDVYFIFKRFLDVDNRKISQVMATSGLQNASSFGSTKRSLAFETKPSPNEFLKKRKVSDELRYILQRREFERSQPDSLMRLWHSSLPNPSLLQNPHVMREGDMETVDMKDGEEIKGFNDMSNENAYTVVRKKECFRGSQAFQQRQQCRMMPRQELQPSIAFLAHGSDVVRYRGTAVNENGVIELDLSSVPFFSSGFGDRGQFEVIVFAIDAANDQMAMHENVVALDDSPISQHTIPTRSLCLPPEEALECTTHAVQVQSHECLVAGDERVIDRSASSKFAVYNSLDSVMELWTTLCASEQLSELAAILRRWHQYDISEKLKFYHLNASDDFHFYLFKKDRAFFDDYVSVSIRQKLSKSFIDHILLENTDTLRSLYFKLGEFQKLSVVEKLLLADRLADSVEQKRICSRVLADISAADHSSLTLSQLFDTLLSGGEVKPQPDEFSMPMADIEESCDFIELSECAAFGAPAPAPGGTPFGSSFAFGAPAQMVCQSQPVGGFASASGMSSIRRACQSSSSDHSENEDSDGDSDDYAFGVESIDSGDNGDEPEADANAKKDEKAKRKQRPFILPGKVRVLEEKRYFVDQRPYIDGRNGFWKDYAAHIMKRSSGGDGVFLSSNFPEALSSLTEGMFVISLLDLEVSPKSVVLKNANALGTKVALTAPGCLVLYHQSIKQTDADESANTSVVVNQVVYDPSEMVSPSERKSPPELLVNTIYECTVSVSNIGARPLDRLSLLLQIPQGSIPIGTNGFYTKIERISVSQNTSFSISYQFYFPATGDFPHYSAQVAHDSKVVAWARDVRETLTVVSEVTHVDPTSWADVSARGSLENVLEYLRTSSNIQSVALHCVGWRCTEEKFYLGLVQFLRENLLFDSAIWKYALIHADEQGTRELLGAVADTSYVIGSGFNTSLISTDRLYHCERFDNSMSFEHTEFGPFYTQRTHPVLGNINSESSRPTLGDLFGPPGVANQQPRNLSRASSNTTDPAKDSGFRRILNQDTRQYYRGLCDRLGLYTSLGADHLLVLTYFMILQNRIREALDLFARAQAARVVTGEATTSGVAVDYMDAFLEFYRPQPTDQQAFTRARDHVHRHKDNVNRRWRERFAALAEVLEEWDAIQKDKHHQNVQASESSKKPEQRPANDLRLAVEVTDAAIDFTSKNVGACTVAFYPIDVELMFSTEPFESFSTSAAASSTLLMVQPRLELNVDLTTQTQLAIPAELKTTQMMVRVKEVVDARLIPSVVPAIEVVRPYFNTKLTVSVHRQLGVVQVFHDGSPVRSCYVKAYAKASSGTAKARRGEFYKDGYTDVLGKFDYATTNGDRLQSVAKFSILLAHPTLGACVQQVDPPIIASTAADFEHRDEQEALWC
ncbi:TPA: hypothetical protein N0F65_004047 [Lagenidium giganteum]|uniref:Uncharacterized protein n=1 Tax=Lagenidium giganteum TaxID=4803 RepID=A0AAV2Z106_9STRA|nr:TPA: hypothetical protein N0F65_004047 [Lagenidium giganteum]